MTRPASPPADALEDLEALLHARRHVSPRRLEAPGPDPAQLRRIFAAAAAAPDHGCITPWRFIAIEGPHRARLAQAFGVALPQRDAMATREQVQAAELKAFNAPFLALAVCRHHPVKAGIPAVERHVSLGCAIQNVLLAAEALGFCSGLSSGKAMQSRPIRELFELGSDDDAVCFISLGTAHDRKPARARPAVDSYFTQLR